MAPMWYKAITFHLFMTMVYTDRNREKSQVNETHLYILTAPDQTQTIYGIALAVNLPKASRTRCNTVSYGFQRFLFVVTRQVTKHSTSERTGFLTVYITLDQAYTRQETSSSQLEW